MDDMRPVLTQGELQIIGALRRGCRKRGTTMSIREIATSVDMAQSSALTILHGLERRGLVRHIAPRSGFILADMLEDLRRKQTEAAGVPV